MPLLVLVPELAALHSLPLAEPQFLPLLLPTGQVERIDTHGVGGVLATQGGVWCCELQGKIVALLWIS